MTLGVFCLGKGAVIPLHDHYGMTVMSRLLFGSMTIRSYDWVKPAKISRALRAAEAKVVRDTTVRAPHEPLVLYPASGA